MCVKKRNGLIAFLGAFVLVHSSGCLQTRAQMRQDAYPGYDQQEEASSAHRPVPVGADEPVEAPGHYALDEIKLAITRLEGRLEDLERAQKDQKSADSSSQVKEEIKSLEERLSKIEESQAEILENLKKTHAQAEVAQADPSVLFDKAMGFYSKENYQQAADMWSSYLKSPKIKRADEATFFRAESFYKLKQFKKAIVDYSKFPEKYTKSNHMPEALFKIGLSFEALGMREDAKGFYQELVEKYPKSAQAKRARPKAK